MSSLIKYVNHDSWVEDLFETETAIVSVLSTGTRPGLVFPQACLALLVAITDKVSESPFFQVDWVAIMLLITCIFFQCRSKNMFIPGLSWIYIPWGILSLPFEVPLVWKSREKMLCQSKIEDLEKMSCFSWFYWTSKKKKKNFFWETGCQTRIPNKCAFFVAMKKTCKHAMGSYPKTRIKTGNVLFSIFPELTKVSVKTCSNMSKRNPCILHHKKKIQMRWVTHLSFYRWWQLSHLSNCACVLYSSFDFGMFAFSANGAKSPVINMGYFTHGSFVILPQPKEEGGDDHNCTVQLFPRKGTPKNLASFCLIPLSMKWMKTSTNCLLDQYQGLTV